MLGFISICEKLGFGLHFILNTGYDLTMMIFFANIPDTRPEPEAFTNTRTRSVLKLKIHTRWALV